MFSKFRNFFSKNKSEKSPERNSETGAVAVTGADMETVKANGVLSETNVAYVSSVDTTKLEGLNLLKSLVETEQQDANKTSSETVVNGSGLTLSQEVHEVLNQKLSNANENEQKERRRNSEETNSNIQENKSVLETPINAETKIENGTASELPQISHEIANESSHISNSHEAVSQPENQTDSVSDLLKKMRTEVMTLNYQTKETSPLPLDKEQINALDKDNKTIPLDSNVEIAKTSLIKSWIQENNANFIPPTPYPLLSTESATNLDNHSSIVMEDLPSEVTTPSPTVDGSVSCGSSSNASTLEAMSIRLAADPTKIIVNPIGDNGMACNSITHKLSDIAEVAESLDTVIRDIQENSQSVEVESNPSPRDKKMGALRSTSSEDWHSRSTEDESFVTASEGRTSSFMSCNKSSYDFSEEGDDSTINFEMPDVNSPFNMSDDGSDHSCRSPTRDSNKTPTKLSESVETPLAATQQPSDVTEIELLHSESVTPTPPAENIEDVADSIPIESETELEVAAIATAPPTNVLSELAALPASMTPEVSSCSNQFVKTATAMINDTATPTINGQHATNTTTGKTSNVAWRRSKYYENLTKQAIKGFL